MINNPSVDEMIKKLGTEEEPVSSYVLCVVASKRARQITEQAQSKGILIEKDKDLSVACKEIADGKVGYLKD